MKESWQKLKEWWAQLAGREKKMVSGGALIVSIAIFYSGCLSPYMHYVARMRERILSQQKTLAAMQVMDQEITTLISQGSKENALLSPIALLSLLQKELQHMMLSPYVTQLKQSEESSIALSLQKVEFDKLMTFLIMARKKYHVAVKQLTIIRENAPGLVNAEMVLSQG